MTAAIHHLANDKPRALHLRPLPHERVELPSLVDIDGALAELEEALSAERLRATTLDPCSILYEWSLQTRLDLDEQIEEALKLRRVVERRMAFRIVKGATVG